VVFGCRLVVGIISLITATKALKFKRLRLKGDFDIIMEGKGLVAEPIA
jgi:hypothetical protein